MLHLIPMPKKIRSSGRKYPLEEVENLLLPENCSSSILEQLVCLADEAEHCTARRMRFVRSGVEGKTLSLKFSPMADPEGYRLKIHAGGIALEGASEAGLFYAIQTLRQLIRTEGAFLPGITVEDAPDFAARGFYHDVTRGKIPTLETLFKLADKMAYYKLNQLQLYIEHTFAFARHSDMWSGADPLTAEEIIRLDHYCLERHIDLVPSLSTFGHFYMGLRSKRKEDLNELEMKASERPFSFRDRMAHYTLNVSDPRSIGLVEDMLAEFLPLFSSPYFNICADETYDLGQGRSAKLLKKLGSREALYVQFLKKIIAAVRKHGKRAMFWGDIIASQPELIRELPSDTIPLEWDYGANAVQRDTRIMQQSGLDFYVCPGVSGWNHFLNNIHVASLNIVNYAKKGMKFGAKGILNTDWGDYGHINFLGPSYHGMALGGACGWNFKAASGLAAFDEAFSVIELGDRTGEILAAWRSAMEKTVFSYAWMVQLFDPGCDDIREAVREKIRRVRPADARAAIKAFRDGAARILRVYAGARPLDPPALEEILWGIRGEGLIHEVLSAVQGGKGGAAPGDIADRLRLFEVDFARLWHKRNKPSEYYRVREVLMQIAEYLDAMEKNQTGLKGPAVQRKMKKTAPRRQTPAHR